MLFTMSQYSSPARGGGADPRMIGQGGISALSCGSRITGRGKLLGWLAVVVGVGVVIGEVVVVAGGNELACGQKRGIIQ
jgi:hypothetical protein